MVCKLKEKWYRVASWEMEDPGTKRQDLADSTTLIDKIQTLQNCNNKLLNYAFKGSNLTTGHCL